MCQPDNHLAFDQIRNRRYLMIVTKEMMKPRQTLNKQATNSIPFHPFRIATQEENYRTKADKNRIDH